MNTASESTSPALRWRKSSYSNGAGGECLECATTGPAILVRDSKRPGGPALAFPSAGWGAFVAAVRSEGLGR
ncbi:DUF397 domain-containing protein [Streptomyces zingiberis]|uniref:DUF397 domain-containing protein n=1 Tax=Streptomyces zingiberis TaxID=2053010 RepID=A0ABX1C2L0_9ACTN|nr:DUF397 domain-containing protein [Streptomyces zingiberis]NJQ01869.1 DUF397 domain-containing protein [Streptomyces zingiberis]